MKTLYTLHGKVLLPTFFPDGTIGVVRAVDSRDLENAQIDGLVVSTYHLLVNRVPADLHRLMSWNRPILTDSGGFQVFSLIKADPKVGKIHEEGVTFKWDGEKINFTPEVSIRKQMEQGADILICLDQCTDPEESFEFQRKAVDLTIEWAKRCKVEFEKLTAKLDKKPFLFAVIQGGNNKELRKRCAEELIKIGFDGYCYGGWPVDGNKKLLDEILKYTAGLMPDEKPKYALGVGKPEDIIKCEKMGYNIFDCVIPTREARHKKLYIWKKEKGLDYETLSLQKSKFSKDFEAISKYCDCHTCQNFTKAYLWHLFKIGDTLSYRLSTIHNLRFYSQLMEKLQKTS